MRKMKIGIFAVATVILFLLSTSVSVTAATHQEILMELTSRVQDGNPKASVSMAPQDVWSNTDWNWTVDINNGDNVHIDTEIIWINANDPLKIDSGYHYYYVEGDYWNGGDHIYRDDDHTEETDGHRMGTGPEQGSDTLHLEFNNLEEGGIISLYWYVYARNEKYGPPPLSGSRNGTYRGSLLNLNLLFLFFRFLEVKRHQKHFFHSFRETV